MSRAIISHRRRGPAPSPWRGTLVLAVVFSTLIGVNLYFFVFRGGTSVRDLVRRTEIHRDGSTSAGSGESSATPVRATPRAAAARPAPAQVELLDEGRVVEGELRADETLAAALHREAVPARVAEPIAAALLRVLEPRVVRAGHRYALRYDAEQHLHGLDYVGGSGALHVVEHRRDAWRSWRESAPLTTRTVEIGGVVQTTLADAIVRAGETTALVTLFATVLAWDLDPAADLQPGDRFRIVVEKQLLGGKHRRYGRILAAEYASRGGGLLRAFATDGGYVNERGEPIARSLLRSPLRYSHSSTARRTPVLRNEQGRLGLDYPTPAGTPAWAIADGSVTFRGPRAGEGQCVVVAHPGGMESTYCRLARLAGHLEVGDAVRQRQVLGYVAAPRLRFAVKLGGHFVDPTRLKPVRVALPATVDRAELLRSLQARRDALTRIALAAPPPARDPSHAD